MRKKFNLRSYLCGILSMLLVASLAAPAMASLVEKTIQVYTGIDIYVNDQKIEPKDANGNPVEVFVYNGTTYLPIRAIGNALDIPVAYDGATTSAYMGNRFNTMSKFNFQCGGINFPMPSYYNLGEESTANDTTRFNANKGDLAYITFGSVPGLTQAQYDVLGNELGTIFIASLSNTGNAEILSTKDISMAGFPGESIEFSIPYESTGAALTGCLSYAYNKNTNTLVMVILACLGTPKYDYAADFNSIIENAMPVQ